MTKDNAKKPGSALIGIGAIAAVIGGILAFIGLNTVKTDIRGVETTGPGPIVWFILAAGFILLIVGYLQRIAANRGN